MTDTAIEAAGLGRRFRRRREPALDGCAFQLPAGRVCAVTVMKFESPFHRGTMCRW